jgi:hypothetical protein
MMLQARQPGSKALMVRQALSCSLTLALAFSVACKEKDPPSKQTAPADTSHNAPVDTSYLPQDVFGPEAVPGATVLQPIDLHSLSDTELKYGIAPKRTNQVEYQPDVIVMEQGDKAIRSVSSNGIEWEFDPNAEHVSEFQEGEIVFTTGCAVGRVISLKKEGDSVKAIPGANSTHRCHQERQIQNGFSHHCRQHDFLRCPRFSPGTGCAARGQEKFTQLGKRAANRTRGSRVADTKWRLDSDVHRGKLR